MIHREIPVGNKGVCSAECLPSSPPSLQNRFCLTRAPRSPNPTPNPTPAWPLNHVPQCHGHTFHSSKDSDSLSPAPPPALLPLLPSLPVQGCAAAATTVRWPPAPPAPEAQGAWTSRRDLNAQVLARSEAVGSSSTHHTDTTNKAPRSLEVRTPFQQEPSPLTRAMEKDVPTMVLCLLWLQEHQGKHPSKPRHVGKPL